MAIVYSMLFYASCHKLCKIINYLSKLIGMLKFFVSSKDTLSLGKITEVLITSEAFRGIAFLVHKLLPITNHQTKGV